MLFSSDLVSTESSRNHCSKFALYVSQILVQEGWHYDDFSIHVFCLFSSSCLLDDLENVLRRSNINEKMNSIDAFFKHQMRMQLTGPWCIDNGVHKDHPRVRWIYTFKMHLFHFSPQIMQLSSPSKDNQGSWCKKAISLLTYLTFYFVFLSWDHDFYGMMAAWRLGWQSMHLWSYLQEARGKMSPTFEPSSAYCCGPPNSLAQLPTISG